MIGLLWKLTRVMGRIDSFCPEITIALNCEWDHVDLYDSREAIGATFRALFGRTDKTIITPENSELAEWAGVEKNKDVIIFPTVIKNFPGTRKTIFLLFVVPGYQWELTFEELSFGEIPWFVSKECCFV